MGIKGFTKTFLHKKEIKWKDLNGKTIAIDAMTEIYRSALGMKNITALTDNSGNPTIHINVIFSIIVNLNINKVKQIWVFDHDSSNNDEFHNPIKIKELLKRKQRKQKSDIKYKELLNKQTELFSDSSEEEKIQQEIDKCKKTSFKVSKKMIDDVKFMLNCFSIQWVDAPLGYEAEHIAACLTFSNIYPCDSVLTTDADALVFGAKQIIKKNVRDKKMYLYDLQELLLNNNITSDDLIKISILLGCDFSDKTKGIGPKTVIKKFKNIELTEDQQCAFEYFKRSCPELSTLNWYNIDLEIKKENIKLFLEWITNEKQFSYDRVSKQINKFYKI